MKRNRVILCIGLIGLIGLILACAIYFLMVPSKEEKGKKQEQEQEQESVADESSVTDESGTECDFYATEYEKGADWVRNIGGYEQDTDYYAFVYDYDGDGKEEAFLVIGTKEPAIPNKNSEILIRGDLWYVGDTWPAEKLKEGVLVSDCQQMAALDTNYILIFTSVDGQWETDMYYVEQDHPKRSFSEENYADVTTKVLRDERLIMTVEREDGWYRPVDKTLIQESSKEYPYVVKDGFYEIMPTREKTQEDFAQLGRGKIILEELAEEYDPSFMQFLRREDGTWHINMFVIDLQFEFYCATYIESPEEGLVEVKKEAGYYRIDPASAERDFCVLSLENWVQFHKEEDLLDFYNMGMRDGRSKEMIQECYDFLQQENVFENDKYVINDYYIMYIDDNMEYDYVVSARPNEWSLEYFADDYEDNGKLMVFMNGKQVYELREDYFCYDHSFETIFRADIDGDNHVELVLEVFNGGNGGPGGFDMLVLKYKDGIFEPMRILSDSENYGYNADLDITVYAGQEADEHVVYCHYLDESIVITGQRATEAELGKTLEPGEVCGGNSRGFFAPDLSEYEGQSALLVEEYLVGETGMVSGIGMAHFLLVWNEEGVCEVADWWIETREETFSQKRKGH